jgi:hypothetical protein
MKALALVLGTLGGHFISTLPGLPADLTSLASYAVFCAACGAMAMILYERTPRIRTIRAR